jgi:hypothetical protein
LGAKAINAAQSRRVFLANGTALAATAFLNTRAAAQLMPLSRADLDFIKANAPKILRSTAPIARLASRAIPLVGGISLAIDLALVVSDILELRQNRGIYRPQAGSAAAKNALQRLSVLGVAASAIGIAVANSEKPRTDLFSAELVKLIGGAGRLEAALQGIESVPGVVRGIVQEELEAQYRAELETKLEEFGFITRLLELEAAKLPAVEPVDELPPKRRRGTLAVADPFSDYYLNGYAPAARKLLPELVERLGNLKNYAAQSQRFAPATVSAVALGRTALAKLSGNLLERETIHAERTRPVDNWLDDAINPAHPNSILAQIGDLDARIALLTSEAALTQAGCVTGNAFGREIPYRAARVGLVGYRRYFYYFINYSPTATETGATDAELRYPVSAPTMGDIELTGYPSTDDRRKIEQEWNLQAARYAGGRCGARDLITGTNVRDPDGMFKKLKEDPDAVDNDEITEMLKDFRDWRALLFAADAGKAQRVILAQTAQIARAALGR